jgi:superfamily II DNA/RNA helicase
VFIIFTLSVLEISRNVPLPLSACRYIPSRTIVFVKYKRQSDRIGIFLAQSGFNVISINADRTLKQRVDAVANFTRNVYQVGRSGRGGSKGQ